VGLAALPRIRLISALHSPAAPWGPATGWRHGNPGARRENTTKGAVALRWGHRTRPVAGSAPRIHRCATPVCPHLWNFLWITHDIPARNAKPSAACRADRAPRQRFSRSHGT
jgi:hypothetical protein